MLFNDPTIWTEILRHGGSVAISVDGLSFEAVGSANGDVAGMVTQEPYDLAGKIVEVSVENDGLTQQNLTICDQQVTNADPTDQQTVLGYSIQKNNYHKQIRVSKNDGGGWHLLTYVNWSGPLGSLRIEITEGEIRFYEEGTLKYSEPFNLPTSNLFIHLHGYASTDYTGADIFSNFDLSYYTPPPPTITISPSEPQNISIIDSIQFTANVSGGTPPYTINWYVNNVLMDSGTQVVFQPIGIGVYAIYAIVTDGEGVTAQSTTVNVTVTEVPSHYILSINSTPIQGIPITIQRED